LSAVTIIVLRIIHILSGIFWVGIVFMMTRFLGPNAKALGPDASKFMQRLMGPMRLLDVAISTAILTILSGTWLVWIMSGGFQSPWFGSAPGMAYSTGGLLGVLTLMTGLGVTRPNLKRLQKLGKEIAAAGGPPSPEQSAEMGAIRAKMGKAGNVAFVLLVGAVIAMSIARYLPTG